MAPLLMRNIGCQKIFLNISALNIHGKTEHIRRNFNVKIVRRLLKLVKIMKFHTRAKHVQPAVLYNYNLCGLCWKIFLNILVLNIHGKTEHIGRNLNVKIVTRLLILVKIMKFNMRAKHIRPAVLLVTDVFLQTVIYLCN